METAVCSHSGHCQGGHGNTDVVNWKTEVIVGIALAALAMHRNKIYFAAGIAPGVAFGLYSGHRRDKAAGAFGCSDGVLDQVAGATLPVDIAFLAAGCILASHINCSFLPHWKVFVPLVGAAIGRRVGLCVWQQCHNDKKDESTQPPSGDANPVASE